MHNSMCTLCGMCIGIRRIDGRPLASAMQVPWDKVFGKDKAPAEFGPFTATAEIINGRAAMLGIAVILFFEGAGNSAFFL